MLITNPNKRTRVPSFPVTDCPVNPFVNNINLDSIEKMKVVLMCLFLAPIRLIFVSFFAGIAYVVTFATLFDQETLQMPLRGLRRKGKDFVANALIWAHFVAGFQVTVKGKRAPSWQAPILVLAPHSSFFDMLPHCVIGAPSCVGKKSLFRTPFVGSFLKLTLPIIVDRECKDSRKETMEQIKERAEQILASGKTGEQWPHVAIFPEGTCTNRTRLITFKPGAFYPKVPVQPICLKWSTSAPDSISWTWEGAGVMQLIWITLSKFYIRLEIEYMPVYFPSGAEKADANLYAKNVRGKMAKHLGLPVADYTLDDAPYLSVNVAPKLANFWTLRNKLNKTWDLIETIPNLRDSWKKMENSPLKSQYFCLSLKEFAKFIDYKEDNFLQRLFNAFDWQCCGKIDVREFLLTHYSKNTESEEYLNLAYDMFCDENESIDENSLVKMLRFPYGISIKDCRAIYSQLETHSNDGSIVYSSILDALRNRGHFVKTEIEEMVKNSNLADCPMNGILKH